MLYEELKRPRIIFELFSQCKYCIGLIWSFNLAVLILNRVYEGYSFSLFGQKLAFLDNYRGTFRWHICFNFVILRMISFGCDYCWTLCSSHFDHKIDSLQKVGCLKRGHTFDASNILFKVYVEILMLT